MPKPLFRPHPICKFFLALIVMALGFMTWDPRKLIEFCLLILLFLCFDFERSVLWSTLRMTLLSLLFFAIALALGNGTEMSLAVSLHLELILLLSLFLFRSPVSELLRGLQSCHMPDSFVLGSLIVFRFIDVLREELRSIRAAASMLPRSGLSPFQRLYRCILLPFVYRLFVLSDQLALSVTSRDFGTGERSQYQENRFRWRDGLLLVAIPAICGVILWNG